MRSRCDSYNTAQISISSGSASHSRAVATDPAESPPPQEADVLIPEGVQTFSRGRSIHTGNITRRPALSAPGVDNTRQSSRSIPHPRSARSTSITAMNRFALPESADVSSEDEDPTEDEEDDVDFWGGQSPRERMTLERTRKRRDDAEDDGDELMDDELEDSEDEDEEEDDEQGQEDEDDDDADEDHMEVFGHR